MQIKFCKVIHPIVPKNTLLNSFSDHFEIIQFNLNLFPILLRFLIWLGNLFKNIYRYNQKKKKKKKNWIGW